MRNLNIAIAASLGLLVACNGNDVPVDINTAPVADAGTSVTQPADQPVTLDGRASYDPDGDIVVFHWTFDHVPADSALANATSPFSPNHTDAAGTTTFRPDVVGTYVVKLEVKDDTLYSAPSYVVVTATEPESIPVASAGNDQLVPLGDTAQLDGSGSFDPTGGTLHYSWSLASAPYNSSLTDSAIVGADGMQATLTGDVAGYYTAALVVSNGQTASLPDSTIVQFTVGSDPAPIASCGDVFAVEDCTTLTLDASGSSDPDGQRLTYYWELQTKPAGSAATNGSFTDRTATVTEFWPDVAGEYKVSCSVFDGSSWSLPDIVTLDVSERSFNSPPVANAGVDRVEYAGDALCEQDGYKYDCESCDSLPITLAEDGEASDADDDPLKIQWTIVDGDATLLNTNAVPADAILSETEPTEPDACEEYPFIFQLSVTDCPGEVRTDQVQITAECCGFEEE